MRKDNTKPCFLPLALNDRYNLTNNSNKYKENNTMLLKIKSTTNRYKDDEVYTDIIKYITNPKKLVVATSSVLMSTM